jgi:hypothetical protein
VQDEPNAPGTSGEKFVTTEVEFADVDGTGVRSNALEFARASRMVRCHLACSLLSSFFLFNIQCMAHTMLLCTRVCL